MSHFQVKSPLLCICREQLAKLSVHLEIASKIDKVIGDKGLVDLGKLEQDLVFGDATSKEIITYISTNQKMSSEDKVWRHHCLSTAAASSLNSSG